LSYPQRACSKCEKLYPFNKKFFEARSDGTLRRVCKACYSAQRAERRKASKPAPPEIRGSDFFNGVQVGDWVQGTINAKYLDAGVHVLELGSGRDATGLHDGKPLASYVTAEVNDTVWKAVESRNTVRITQEADGEQRLEILQYGWRDTPKAGKHDLRTDVRNKEERIVGLRPKKEVSSGV
jgi:hypothetical protein